MIHRLTAAAANADMRQDMNVEDEYFKAIEDRDTAIIEREATIKEKDKLIAEKDTRMVEMAKLMLASGMSADVVAKAMNISVEKLAELQNK